MVRWCNLWLFCAAGWGIGWVAMALVNRKRGRPVEDPKLYGTSRGKICLILGWLLFLAALLVGMFTPVGFGALFWIGLALCVLGITVEFLAICSFAHVTGGVNTTGIYRYSRNPMYVGGLVFLLGLCLMGWSTSPWSVTFSAVCIIWIGFTHWSVGVEEAFLEEEYGEAYREYLRRTPRYVGCPASPSEKRPEQERSEAQ